MSAHARAHTRTHTHTQIARTHDCGRILEEEEKNEEEIQHLSNRDGSGNAQPSAPNGTHDDAVATPGGGADAVDTSTVCDTDIACAFPHSRALAYPVEACQELHVGH